MGALYYYHERATSQQEKSYWVTITSTLNAHKNDLVEYND